MKPYAPYLSIVLLLILLFASIGCGGVPKDADHADGELQSNALSGYETYTNGRFIVAIETALWEASLPAYRPYETVDLLLAAVSDGMERIAEKTSEDWLSRYDPEVNGMVVVRINGTENGSYTAGGYVSKDLLEPTIYLNENLFCHGLAPLFHELTHLICQDYQSITLREGLAGYLHDDVCTIPTVFNYGLDPHQIAEKTLLADAKGRAMVAEIGSFDRKGETGKTDQRATYYVFAYSFVKYLIDTYGMDAFIQLYTAADEAAYATVTGKSLTALQADWTQSLDAYANVLDEQTYQAYLGELFANHGLTTE